MPIRLDTQIRERAGTARTSRRFDPEVRTRAWDARGASPAPPEATRRVGRACRPWPKSYYETLTKSTRTRLRSTVTCYLSPSPRRSTEAAGESRIDGRPMPSERSRQCSPRPAPRSFGDANMAVQWVSGGARPLAALGHRTPGSKVASRMSRTRSSGSSVSTASQHGQTIASAWLTRRSAQVPPQDVHRSPHASISATTRSVASRPVVSCFCPGRSTRRLCVP